MLISFSFENWMSFRDMTRLSMVASRERQHLERVPRLQRYQTRLLPIMALYGGNASGKTNLFKALNFIKALVVRGTQPDNFIAVDVFKLRPQPSGYASLFCIELLINEEIYEFKVRLTHREILEERLIHITSKSERVLYHRQGDTHNLEPSLLSQDPSLEYAFRGTRDNQLFLTNTVSQQITHFRPVYDWFKETLELVAPDSRFEAFEHFLDEGHALYGMMNESLPMFDMGIERLGVEELSFESLPLAESLKVRLKEELREGMTVRLLVGPLGERLLIARRGGELIAKKLVTYHKQSHGEEVKFEVRQESDGSQRMIELLPALIDLAAPSSHKVYVIDELDRSLHVLLTRRLLERYLSTCAVGSRSQLLLTTHDVSLMDQGLFRRDEMWVAERDPEGVSRLLALSDYKDARRDKALLRSYLQGRFGGVPRVVGGVI